MKLATQVHIAGDPVVTFTFYGLPSVNTHYNKHFRPRSIETNEYRLEAREEAQWWMYFQDKLEHPVIKRALVVVKIWVPNTGVADIHNEWVKAILDGFTDAGLYQDDEWATMPIVIFMWAGVGEFKPRQRRLKRTDIEIHELGLIAQNGIYVKLPKGGRRRYEINWDTSTEV